MIHVLMLSCALIIALVIFNSLLDSICGLDSSGNHGKVLEGTLTILMLYFVLIALFGKQLLNAQIPFVSQLDETMSLTSLFKETPSIFLLECAKLISLTFVISLIASYVPSSFGGNGLSGTIIRSIVLVFAGIIANNFFLSAVQGSFLFSWGLSALQCFFSGAALALTPATVIGNLLNLDSNSTIVAFLIKNLPQTKVGKAMTTSATNSILLVLIIMMFESQYGSIGSLMSQVPSLISLCVPFIIMIMGIRLMIRSVTK